MSQGPALAVLHGDAQFEANVAEPGLLGVPDQVTLVEVEHGIGRGRLDRLIERCDPGSQWLNRCDVVAGNRSRSRINTPIGSNTLIRPPGLSTG